MTAPIVERRIRAALNRKARVHPELHRPIGFAAFRRVLDRESVSLSIRPHPVPAQLVPMLGAWTIVIDARQSTLARLVCGLHELGHLWLHHDPFFARHETTVYDGSPPWYDAVREEEADVFAELLVRGPEKPVTPPLADVSTSANKRVTAPAAARVPPFDDGRAYERRLVKQGAQRVTTQPATWIREWWRASA